MENTTEKSLVQPMRGYIAVRRLQSERKTAGGLYIPEDAQSAPNHGWVVAVGDARVLESGRVLPVQCKVDDEVVFSENSAVAIAVGSDEFLMLDERAVLARL